MRGVTGRYVLHIKNRKFLLTRLMRGVTLLHKLWLFCYHISTHTPHARRDTFSAWQYATLTIFLLTRLMRGVTFYKSEVIQDAIISTHTPHARRDLLAVVSYLPVVISTHTPHARRDLSCLSVLPVLLLFLLTRLMRGVTATYSYMLQSCLHIRRTIN